MDNRIKLNVWTWPASAIQRENVNLQYSAREGCMMTCIYSYLCFLDALVLFLLYFLVIHSKAGGMHMSSPKFEKQAPSCLRVLL